MFTTISPSSRKYGEITMSEAIILYRGGRGSADPESLKPQVITSSGTYVAPITGTYWIGVVGGGGGGGGGCITASSGTSTYYGGRGTRGNLNSGNITLNAGDKISMSLGAGGAAGTNNTTKITYSNGCNNSAGTNGSAGGTTFFGSYRSGSGGAYGQRAWSYQSWNNKVTWTNLIAGWNNTPIWNNNYTSNDGINTWRCSLCKLKINISNPTKVEDSYYTNATTGVQVVIWTWYWFTCPSGHNNIGYANWWYTTSDGRWVEGNVTEWRYVYMGYGAGWNNTIVGWNNTPKWSNTPAWTNAKSIISNGCYTSILQGTWWYQNANNQVSTSGTRTYRGDGGNSGRAGNAGFIIIKPPQI